MSDSAARLRERSERSPRANGFVLPQWGIELLRPLVKSVTRVLWHVRFKGLENIPAKDGLIIAANHQSYIDPFFISIPIKRPLRYLAWNVAFGWPVVGRAMWMLGAWPLQLEGSDPAAIRRSLQWLRAGGAIMIFPEGGRGKPDGSMVRFKAGAVRIALEAKVPILPITIRGANEVWPAGKHVPRLGKVEVVFHPLFYPEPRPDEDTRECARREIQQLAGIIQSALNNTESTSQRVAS
jgi:1-acyl-sn-glycerol-3-phosphate acyltransferase